MLFILLIEFFGASNIFVPEVNAHSYHPSLGSILYGCSTYYAELFVYTSIITIRLWPPVRKENSFVSYVHLKISTVSNINQKPI